MKKDRKIPTIKNDAAAQIAVPQEAVPAPSPDAWRAEGSPADLYMTEYGFVLEPVIHRQSLLLPANPPDASCPRLFVCAGHHHDGITTSVPYALLVLADGPQPGVDRVLLYQGRRFLLRTAEWAGIEILTPLTHDWLPLFVSGRPATAVALATYGDGDVELGAKRIFDAFDSRRTTTRHAEPPRHAGRQ